MAGPLRQVMLLCFRLHSHQHFTATVATRHRLWFSAATEPESGQADKKVSSFDKTTSLPRADLTCADDVCRKWKEKEEEILGDIEPILMLTKQILHSPRYMDGERSTVEDEKAVVEKLLAYHPHSEDKIGCGIESIIVDRHPQFRYSRCLFVVRTDGGWTDFSYKKCLRQYIRDKYPSHGKRFIQERFKRAIKV